MNFEMFKKMLSDKRLTLNSFAVKAGIPRSTVYSWDGRDVKRVDYIDAIERILGVKYESLCTPESPPQESPPQKKIKSTDLRPSETHKTSMWPIIGRAAGGPWIEALETSEYTTYADSYMQVSTTYEDPNGYALTVVGESMEPVLPDGTEIAVSPNRPARNGDIAVIFVQSDISDQAEVCVKRFYFNGSNNDKVRLVSYNSDYPEIVLPATKILKTHRVVEWRVVVKQF